MKEFSCSDVVPDCDATFRCDTEHDVLTAAVVHVSRAHGLTDIGADLLAVVRSAIHAAA